MTLIVQCLAAFAIVAYCTSAGLALVLWLTQKSISRLAPAAQARVYLLATVLPLVAGAAILTAALAPSFGWIADHCAAVASSHTHPHICAEHNSEVWPAMSVVALALLLAVRFGWVISHRVRALVLGHCARRALNQASVLHEDAETRILPSDTPQAFVLGLVRPTLYLTRGLIAGAERRHLDAVVAHEWAHVTRRDPLRRFVGGIALAFHLPGVARRLEGTLVRAQEMAADEAAADVVGSREGIASALVALAKAKSHVPPSAHAFSGSDVRARVLQLMDTENRRDWPRAPTLLVAFSVAMAMLAAGADGVHHGVEHLLDTLGS